MRDSLGALENLRGLKLSRKVQSGILLASQVFDINRIESGLELAGTLEMLERISECVQLLFQESNLINLESDLIFIIVALRLEIRVFILIGFSLPDIPFVGFRFQIM